MTTLPKIVRRKRFELVLLTLLVLVTASGAVIVFGVVTEESPVFSGFLGLLVILFVSYLIESEFRLQRLQDQLFQEQMRALEEQARQSTVANRLKELTALYKGMETVGREESPDKALGRILETVMDLCSADRGSIMLLEKSSDELVIAVSEGIPPEIATKARVRMGESVAGLVAKTGKPLIISGAADPGNFSNLVMKSSEFNSCICAPLRTRNRIIGVINCCVMQKSNRKLTEHDLQLLMVFAQYAAVILEHAYLTMAARKTVTPA